MGECNVTEISQAPRTADARHVVAMTFGKAKNLPSGEKAHAVSLYRQLKGHLHLSRRI